MTVRIECAVDGFEEPLPSPPIADGCGKGLTVTGEVLCDQVPDGIGQAVAVQPGGYLEAAGTSFTPRASDTDPDTEFDEVLAGLLLDASQVEENAAAGVGEEASLELLLLDRDRLDPDPIG